MLKWLDRIPLSMLAIVAIFMALAPFRPEPHLWQKLTMLFAGSLSKPIDIFDLLIHGVPLLLLVIRLLRMGMIKGEVPPSND
ncbi:MAG: RND transporter [gamma proteobacterium symbiont of Bathyaustriella thionipta]|nr:RND transporter [gamma proteobacterium symbiont of Bathyaustriella thionipta]